MHLQSSPDEGTGRNGCLNSSNIYQPVLIFIIYLLEIHSFYIWDTGKSFMNVF